MPGIADRVERRRLFQTAVHAVKTTPIKTAAAGNVRAHLLIVLGRNFFAAPFDARVRNRNRIDQQLHIRMFGIFNHFDRAAPLGHRTLIEQMNFIADLVGGRQIVGDVQKRDVVLVPQPQHDVENHGAQRSIHHRNRLVGDDQARFEHIGAGVGHR